MDIVLAVVCCVCEQRISVELSYALLRDDLDVILRSNIILRIIIRLIISVIIEIMI